MRKEDIRGIYDGSIFYKKAEENERKQRIKDARKAQGHGTVAPTLVVKAKKLL